MAELLKTLSNLIEDDEGNLSWNKTISTGKIAFEGLRKYSPHGFFTKFQSKTDFALTLVAPIVAPFALTALSTVLTIGAGIAALTFLSSLVVAGVAAAFDRKDIRDAALKLTVISGVLTAGLALFATLASLTTTVASLIALTYLATRATTSVVQKAGFCDASNSNYRIYDEIDEAPNDTTNTYGM